MRFISIPFYIDGQPNEYVSFSDILEFFHLFIIIFTLNKILFLLCESIYSNLTEMRHSGSVFSVRRCIQLCHVISDTHAYNDPNNVLYIFLYFFYYVLFFMVYLNDIVVSTQSVGEWNFGRYLT